MNEKKQLKWMGYLAFVVVTISMTVTQVGCLTPAQIASIERANIESRNIAAVILKYDDEIKKVQGWIEAKKVDTKEGQALVKKLIDDRDQLKDRAKSVEATLIDLKKNETPWYGYLLVGLNAVAGIGGAFFGVNKIGSGLAGAASVSRGLDRGLSDPRVSTEAAAAILESLSRSVDADGTRSKAKALHHSAANGTI